MSRGWQQSCTELSTVVLGESLIQRLARGRRLYNMPQTKLLTRCHTTVRVQLWCSMSSLSGTKQTRLTLEDWYEKNATLYSDGELAWKTQRQEHSEYELWYSFPSESAFTAINTVLRGLMWLIFGFFSTQAFVARFTAQKLLWCHSAFYIATSSVQSWRHALLCFLLLLTEETHNHKKHTHTHQLCPPWALGFVPPASVPRMSNAVTVNPQSPRLGYIFWQWLLLGLKKATLGKQEA